MTEPLYWESVLSSEITMHIFTFLDHSSLNVAENVCKTWKDLAHEKSIWRSIANDKLQAMLSAPPENFVQRIDTRLRGPNCQIFPSQKTDKVMEDIKFDLGKIKRGTNDKIIDLFTSPFSAKKYTENDLDVFLMCYQDFLPPSQLLCRVLQKCFIDNLIESNVETFEGPFYVLFKWIQLGPEDFSPDMLILLNCVIKYVQSAVDITKCQTVLAVKNYLSTAKKRIQYYETPLIPFKPTESAPSILSFDPKEVAEHLTFLEHNLYTHIKRNEFFNRAWKTPQKHTLSPHVSEVIRRFSKLSSWLASAILSCKLPSERAKVIIHLVDILLNLRKLNNFNAASAIVGGLSSAPVFRLKKTWDCVPKKYVALLEQEESDLMESRANYIAYRRKMRSISGVCFPYLGVLLSDLTFIDDGNAAMRNGQIMFTRLHLINESIEEFFVHIRKPFPLQDFKPSPKLEELVGYIYGTNFNDNELYHLSLEREPKIVS